MNERMASLCAKTCVQKSTRKQGLFFNERTEFGSFYSLGPLSLGSLILGPLIRREASITINDKMVFRNLQFSFQNIQFDRMLVRAASLNF